VVLARQLERIRETRFATEHEETRAGYGSMAVPVFGSADVVIGALAITAPNVRLNISRFTTALRAAAEGIGRKLRSAS